MQEDFDRWNAHKQSIDARSDEPPRFPKEGSVWMCSIGKNIGFEQNGGGEAFMRPALVVKKFNNKMYWVVPLTSKQKPFDFYYNFTAPGEQEAAAVLAQLRLVSVKRFVRDMYEMSAHDFSAIRATLTSFLGQSKPRTRRGFSRPPETGGTFT